MDHADCKLQSALEGNSSRGSVKEWVFFAAEGFFMSPLWSPPVSDCVLVTSVFLEQALMKKPFVFACLCVLICLSMLATVSHGGTMSVIGSISPELNGNGIGVLGWDGQHLLSKRLFFIPETSEESGGGSIGEIRSEVVGLDTSDGSKDWSILPSESWACSNITWDGECYFASGNGHVAKLSKDGTSIEKFSVLGRPNAKFSGIAWDGSYFWVSDIENYEILKLDPTDMSVLQTVGVPDVTPCDLAWDGTSLWCLSARHNDSLLQIDSTGSVVERWTLPSIIVADGPDAITFDGEYLRVLSRGELASTPIVRGPQIYQIAVPEPTAAAILPSFLLACGICLLKRYY